MAETLSQLRARLKAEREAAHNAPIQDARRSRLFGGRQVIGASKAVSKQAAPIQSAGIIAGDVKEPFNPPAWLLAFHHNWHRALAFIMFMIGVLTFTVPEIVPGAPTDGEPQLIKGLVAGTMGGLMVWGGLACLRSTARNASRISKYNSFTLPYWIIATAIFGYVMYSSVQMSSIERVLFPMMTEEAQTEALMITPREWVWTFTKALALSMIGARVLTGLFFRPKKST